MRFSANLGFLWSDLPMTQAIGQAAKHGFSAVEAHWPYGEDPVAVKQALVAQGLPLLSVNSLPGDRQAGEFGLMAVPGRNADAAASLDAALAFAAATGCGMVHAMAGRAQGPAARATFVDNLKAGAARAAALGITLVIEPINRRDVPGYFLQDLDQAASIVEAVGADNLGILFDCYHLQVEGGDLLRRFERHRAIIRHVQFAAVPDRSEPDEGEVDYRWLLPRLRDAGHDGWFGAEYRPRSTTADGLGWMARLGGR